MPTITDNRGNGALLNKLMSTKFPASAVLMELASYMRRMSLRTVVEWAPREGNKKTDKLANGNTEDFDLSLRIDVRCPGSTLSWRECSRSPGSKGERRSPRQVQERQTKKTRRASAVEGSMVRQLRKKTPSSRLVNSYRHSTMVSSLSRSLPFLPLSSSSSASASLAFVLFLTRYFMYGVNRSGRGLRIGQILVRMSLSEASSDKSSELGAHQISLGSPARTFPPS